jgi:hypothetical protein
MCTFLKFARYGDIKLYRPGKTSTMSIKAGNQTIAPNPNIDCIGKTAVDDTVKFIMTLE